MGMIVNCDGDDLPEPKENNPYIGENKTEMDAFDRVWYARGGFLSGHPTLEYLKALKLLYENESITPYLTIYYTFIDVLAFTVFGEKCVFVGTSRPGIR